MEINRQALFPFLIFNQEIKYNDWITLYPIKMKDVVAFQQYQSSFTLRKDSIFCEKEFIKMEYLDFIKFACRNEELAQKYQMPLLPYYYDFMIGIFQLACGDKAELKYNSQNLDFFINGFQITNSVFEDLRRIIILQNDIDFDVDEFINMDTVKALERAKEFEAKKNKEKSDIEDYIDSFIIDMKATEKQVSNMTIRKFWRYIKRINKHEEYQACRSGEMSGMVTFKEPLPHWMTSIEVTDKYENLKSDADKLRSKIG